MLPTQNMYRHCMICHTQTGRERQTVKQLNALLLPNKICEQSWPARNVASPWLGSTFHLGHWSFYISVGDNLGFRDYMGWEVLE